MKVIITLSKNDVKQIIKDHLLREGYKTTGDVNFTEDVEDFVEVSAEKKPTTNYSGNYMDR